jgi:hypothetical protein
MEQHCEFSMKTSLLIEIILLALFCEFTLVSPCRAQFRDTLPEAVARTARDSVPPSVKLFDPQSLGLQFLITEAFWAVPMFSLHGFDEATMNPRGPTGKAYLAMLIGLFAPIIVMDFTLDRLHWQVSKVLWGFVGTTIGVLTLIGLQPTGLAARRVWFNLGLPCSLFAMLVYDAYGTLFPSDR